MKIIIFVMLLTALPMSINWGQVYQLTDAEIDSIWNNVTIVVLRDSITALNKRLDEYKDSTIIIHAKFGELTDDGNTIKPIIKWEAQNIYSRDSRAFRPIKPNWQGYWRIDTTDMYWIPKPGGGYYDEPIYFLDTTWRPIVPVEEGGE